MDVVIPVHNQRERLARLLPGLLADPTLTVWVADDASTDRPEIAHPPHPRLRVLRFDRRSGPAAARALGWAAGGAEFVLALDSDAAIAPRAIAQLAEHLRRQPRLAAIGPVLMLPGGGVHTAGIGIEPDGMTRLLTTVPAGADPVPVDAVCSAAALYRRAAVDAVGGFDPRLWYYEDVDLCWRLRRAGHQVAVAPGLAAGHEWGGTMGRDRSLVRFYRQEYARRRMLARNLALRELWGRLPALVGREAWLVGWSLIRLVTDLISTRGSSLLYPAALAAGGWRNVAEWGRGELRVARERPRATESVERTTTPENGDYW